MVPIQKVYLQARVSLHYSNSAANYTDTGTIIYLDENWLELRKDNGERFLVPTHALRLIKLLDSKIVDEATSLLRPAEGEQIKK